VGSGVEAGLKRLLAITWSAPPLLVPRAVQVQRTLHYLSRDHGWQVHLLTVTPASVATVCPLDYSLESLYPSPERTIQVASPESRMALRLLWRAFPALAQLPDRQRLWAERAARRVRSLAQTEFAAVLTFSHPLSSHLVGLAAKRALGLPWIAHFSDPWTGNPFAPAASAVVRGVNARLERQVLGAADHVIFVNERLRDLTFAEMPEAPQAKVTVIPQGFDPTLTPAGSSRARDGRLTLRYTGHLYGPRSPAGLVEALTRLSSDETASLRVSLVGRIEAEHMERLRDIVRLGLVDIEEPVPYTASLERLAEADCLLVLDAASKDPSPFLPSKLVDYLAFGKPIVGLTPLEGASADLLRRLGCTVTAPDDPASIAAALRELIAAWRSGALAPGAGFQEVAGSYDIRRTTAQLARVLESFLPLPGCSP